MPYSPPAMPVTTWSRTISGAAVLLYPAWWSATSRFQTRLPVRASMATRWASRVLM